MDNVMQTVFVVDDDPSVLRTLPRGLVRRGYKVEAYNSGPEFLNANVAHKPGCLVLDLSMPQMNGLELQQALIERNCHMPIIFITGHGGVPDSVKALRAGAIDFLEKPFEPETLLQRIEEAFERDRALTAERQNAEKIRSRFERLTKREREVLDLLLADPKAASSKGIAGVLGISHRTVEQHRARILEKTKTSSLIELVNTATQAGITAPQSDTTPG